LEETLKVCLDAGHGGIKSGAVYDGLLEKDVNLSVVQSAGRSLVEIGHEVVYTRETDVDVSLQERCNIANQAHCDIFISVHCNADLDEDLPGMPEAKGEEIWHYASSDDSIALANALAEGVDAIFPDEPFRGIKPTTNLYVLKHTNMPAVLIEIGFIDKSSSVEKFSDPFTIDFIGTSIIEGVVDFETNRS
jgi:N-acetylmuramoyl-L-alanine amidase